MASVVLMANIRNFRRPTPLLTCSGPQIGRTRTFHLDVLCPKTVSELLSLMQLRGAYIRQGGQEAEVDWSTMPSMSRPPPIHLSTPSST